MKLALIFASLSGFLSVALGAAGDHAFAGSLKEYMQTRWDVAQDYHQLYSITLLVLALYGLKSCDSARSFRVSLSCFAAGIILFSGSLYLSILLNLEMLTYLTPFGGLLLMLGWLTLLVYASRLHTPPNLGNKTETAPR